MYWKEKSEVDILARLGVMKALLELSEISSRLLSFLFYLNCQPPNFPLLSTTMDLHYSCKQHGRKGVFLK